MNVLYIKNVDITNKIYKFGFCKGKDTEDAIGLIRNISERILDVKEEMGLCFIDRQTAFSHIGWTKHLKILKNNRVD